LTDGPGTRFAAPSIKGGAGGVDNVSMPGPDDELAEEERRQRREQAVDAGDAGTDVAAASTGWCDGCDFPSCDLPDCDCGGCDLLRVSSLLALVVPVGTGGLVATVIELSIRGYRRWLTRFTPACPSEPNCSAYALTAVTTLGARRDLRAAARRVRSCGRPACAPR
jgi:putative component of membrane protein insertase Oxa1/YidC/SpoIIIJ protein YidD